MSSIREKLAATESKLARIHEKTEDHPAELIHSQEGQLFYIDLNLIKPNPEQPRQHFDHDALAQLSDSVREKGVLQPLLVRHGDNGQIFLIAGDRRLRAAKTAGLEKVPAIFTTGNPMEIAIIENVQRENLKPMEEAEALQRLADKHNYTLERLSAVMGKAQSTVSEKLSLNRLPEEIKDEVRHSDYPLRMLVEIAKQKTVEDMLELFTRIKQNNLTSSEVRAAARSQKALRKDRTPITIIKTRVHSLLRCLKGLNPAKIEETSERDKVKEQLQKAKERIEEALEKLG